MLRVFTGPGGEHGNPLGVFLDGTAVPAADRQGVAAELGFSETVFVDDPATGRLQIFTPATEYPFAGHPLVGTAWLLARSGKAPAALRPPAGDVPVRFEEDLVHIAAPGEWAPFSEFVELGSVEELEAMEGAPGGSGDYFFWAWIDEAAGRLGARCFAPGAGIAEDEATGSAVLALAVSLDRPISVRQGRGSELVARPLGEGRGEVGGRIVPDEAREWSRSRR